MIKVKFYTREPLEDRQRKLCKMLRKLGGESYDDWAQLIGACNMYFTKLCKQGIIIDPQLHTRERHLNQNRGGRSTVYSTNYDDTKYDLSEADTFEIITCIRDNGGSKEGLYQ